MSKSFSFNRRAFLRGAMGTGVAVGLPTLEAMVGTRKLAQAAGAQPKRLITVYIGNGVPTLAYCSNNAADEKWIPPTLGANFTLSECMKPLEKVKQYTRVMSGLVNPHHSQDHCGNMSGTMTGFAPPSNFEDRLGGPTPDFVASKHLYRGSGVQRISGLVAGSANGVVRGGLTFNDQGQRQNTTRRPADIFTQLFQNFTPGGGAPVAVDPALLRRRAILDYVRGDTKKLQAQLGSADKQRLDQHLTAIDELQKSIMGVSTTGSSSCTKPGVPMATAADDYRAISAQMIDLMVMAFACDLTQVAAFGPSGCNSEAALKWIYAADYHHDVSHIGAVSKDSRDTLFKMVPITQWHMQQVADLVEKLAKTQWGTEKLIDSTLVVTSSEHGGSHNHSGTDIPHVVFGGPSLVTGNFHWRAPGAPQVSTGDMGAFNPSYNSSRLWLSTLQALGCPVTQYGSSGTSTIPLK
jgi:hypothetical protein